MKAIFLVTKEIQARVKSGEVALLSPGEIVSFNSEKAELLIRAGKLRPLSLTENMALEQFGVESAILNEVICFASSESVAAKLRGEGFIVYTPRELEALTGKKFQPGELKKLHEIKAVFSGSRVIQ